LIEPNAAARDHVKIVRRSSMGDVAKYLRKWANPSSST